MSYQPQKRKAKHTAPTAQELGVRAALSRARKSKLRAYVESRGCVKGSDAHRYQRILELLEVIERFGLEDRFEAASLDALVSMPWVRPLQEWKPSRSSKKEKAKSLHAHLIAKYPLPWFVLEDLLSFPGLTDFAARLGRGDSLVKVFPFLTRKMAHRFLTYKKDELITLSHKAQSRVLRGAGRSDLSDLSLTERALMQTRVEAFSGHPSLISEFLNFSYHRQLRHRPLVARTPLSNDIIHWFCQQPFLDPSAIQPLLDYIQAHPQITLFGRTVASVTRLMERWHGELNLGKTASSLPDTFKEHMWKRLDDPMWEIAEITRKVDLLSEGRVLKHCVASYGSRIVRGEVSICSLRRYGERCITIEVALSNKTIVQARGRHNRLTSPIERAMISKWARLNNLKSSF